VLDQVSHWSGHPLDVARAAFETTALAAARAIDRGDGGHLTLRF